MKSSTKPFVLCLLSFVLSLPSFPITATKEYVDRQDKKKLDLPAVTIPTNFVPVTIGEGRVAWKLMQGGGGGGGSLGKVTQLQDESGNWHNVSSAWNEVTHEYDLVIDPNIAPHEEMTVQQEMERAVGAETKLFETNVWETTQRIAGDYALQTQIDSLSSLGRFVSTLDTTTGKPSSEPLADPFIFQGGDYYIVGKVDDSTTPTNYIPAGPVYRHGVAFTNIAPDEVYVNDVYRYTDDGSWVHVVMKGASVTWSSLVGNPLDNTNFIVGAHIVTTQTVTKAYVEGLGIQSCDTNKVNDLIHSYDVTNITPRIENALNTNKVNNLIAIYDATNITPRVDERVILPDESVPAGYSLVRGVTSRVDWVQLPATNIVGFLGYIRDLDGNAYRVIAEPNPAGSVVASIEQTPTPVTVITIDEEYARATNAEYQIALAATNYANAVALSTTNYTDSATNALSGVLLPLIIERATTNDLIAATNALDIAHLAALAATNAAIRSAIASAAASSTNYTDTATNSLSSALRSAIAASAASSTNYTDSVKTTLETAIAAEATARQDADAVLTADLKSAATAATNYANSVAISATNYTDAVKTTLETSIAAEATARADADTALNNAIAAETTARQSADAVLTADLKSASIAATNYTDAAKTALNNAITAEATARQSADTSIRSALAASAASSTNYTDAAKSALNTALAAETTRATTAETTLGNNLAAETTRATTAENTLTSNLNTEISTARGNEASLQTAINTEKSRAETAESNLQAAINAEATTRANADTAHTTAISNLDSELADEASARAGADTTLQNNIDAEINARVAADNTLQNNITSEATARANADALLIPLAQKAANNGVATLDNAGKVPVDQLPNSVLPIWGSITGSLSSQSDLASALASKQNNLPDAIPDYYLHSNYDTGELEWKAVTGGGGTGNYNELTNKPKIENHLLSGGNQTAASLGLQTNLVVDATVANKVLKNDGSTLFWGSGGGGGGEDCIPITKTVASATDIKNLFENAFEKSWDDIPQNSSMIVYATGLPYADNTFPNSEGYCVLRYRTYRYAYIEFICPTVIKNGTKFNKMQNGTWKGWTDPPLPIFNINSPTSYMDLFNKMGYVYGMDGFTASGIATGLNIDPAKGDYFPHPNCYITLSSLNNACYRIQATGFNQTGVLWERREESGDWRPWTRIDGNVSQKTIWGDYKDCDNIFLEAFCATNSQPDKATITGYAYNLNTAIFPEQTGFLTMRQVDSNNKQIEFRSTNPDTPVKYNTKTNGVWTGWKSSDPLQTTALILNGGPEQITGPMVVPNGYGTAGQVLVSNGSSTAPGWGDLKYSVVSATKKSGVLGSVVCYRYGRVVTLVFDQFNIPSSVGTMAECVTIPAGYRPKQWLIGGLVTTTAASGGINISPSTGVSQLFGSYNLNYYGCVTYITGDAMP